MIAPGEDGCGQGAGDRGDTGAQVVGDRVCRSSRCRFILCHRDLTPSWTLAEDLAGVDPRAVAASSDRSSVYATAARLDPRCTGWAAVRGVAWYGQHRTSGNDHIAATSVAELIVTTAKSTALNYR